MNFTAANDDLRYLMLQPMLRLKTIKSKEITLRYYFALFARLSVLGSNYLSLLNFLITLAQFQLKTFYTKIARI